MSSTDSPFAAASVVTHSWNAALKLAQSFHSHHPGRPFHFLALAPPPTDLALPRDTEITLASSLNLPDFHSAAMRYQPAELAARLKPRFLLDLLARYENILYLAPEILVCESLCPVLAHLENASIVLTPRYTVPFAEPLPPEEVETLVSGHYHSGFFAVRNSPSGLAFLRWLEERCRELAFEEPLHGLSLDQKWLNLAPCLFEGVHIDRSPGLLLGVWNLQKRSLSKENSTWLLDHKTPVTLVFRASQTAQTQIPGRDAGGFPNEWLLDAEDFAQGQPSSPYPFGSFADGTPISAVARRVFAISAFQNSEANPFLADSEFERFCKQNRLDGPGEPLLQPEALPERHFLAQIIRFGFALVVRIFGAPLYEIFLKYLRFLSSVRNQHEIFFKKNTPEGAGLDSNVFGELHK